MKYPYNPIKVQYTKLGAQPQRYVSPLKLCTSSHMHQAHDTPRTPGWACRVHLKFLFYDLLDINPFKVGTYLNNTSDIHLI